MSLIASGSYQREDRQEKGTIFKRLLYGTQGRIGTMIDIVDHGGTYMVHKIKARRRQVVEPEKDRCYGRRCRETGAPTPLIVLPRCCHDRLGSPSRLSRPSKDTTQFVSEFPFLLFEFTYRTIDPKERLANSGTKIGINLDFLTGVINDPS
jgi:hypothetical protein